MTNKINRHKDKHNHWVEFESVDDPKGRSLEASAYARDVVVTVYGPEYRDRDNYVCYDSAEFPLDLTETIVLRDFLNEAIEHMEKVEDDVD